MKIVFMGTPDLAVPSLKKMIEKYNVSAIVTQPDKPKLMEKLVRVLQASWMGIR